MRLQLTLPHEYSPRSYQREVFTAYREGARRFVLVWHRRSGKDKTMLNFMICRMLERRGMYWYVLPTYEQARLIIWEGMGSGGTSEGMPFLDHFPEELVQYKNEQRLEIGLVNGSIFRLIGSDHVDRIVGANPVGAVFSEYSLQQPAAWEFVAPILVENKGWAAFIFTPRGRNHAFKLWESAQGARGWYSTIHTVDDTKRDAEGEDGTAVVTEEMLLSERDRGVEEDLIQQEYYCSFVGFREGSYYGRQMADLYKTDHIRDISWDPKFPVFTGWDLGIADQTAIWFAQRIGREIFFIDYYFNVNKGLDHYIKICKDKPYIYGKHFAPHDIEHREFTSGKSRREIARDLGIMFTPTAKLPIQEGIDNARTVLPRCYFDKSKCDMGIRALINYHKDFNNRILTFKNNPVHDVWSHGADAFRTICLKIDDMDAFRQIHTEYTRDFDIFEDRSQYLPGNRPGQPEVSYEHIFDIFGAEK
jgi:phage terminase large subunit